MSDELLNYKKIASFQMLRNNVHLCSFLILKMSTSWERATKYIFLTFQEETSAILFSHELLNLCLKSYPVFSGWACQVHVPVGL